MAGALSLLAPAAAQAEGQVRAGAAVLDGTYHVGNSAGQYASTRDGGYGDVDPHVQSVKNQASYGVQSRESVRALVVRGGDGRFIALVSNDHYIPQDALWRRTAQLLDARTNGLIDEKNLTLSVTHNHSSPSYSSFDWGVWSFQDVFDFRFFDYYANQNAAAVEKALENMHDVRVSATVSHFDAFQKNPMGPGWADDGTPDGFPRPYTDHDLSIVYFESLDSHRALATLKYPAPGGRVWKWTASFEAFVSRFPLVDPAGRTYTATPTGTYRFVVHGRWRKVGADKPYTRISNSFEVRPWNGITVEDAKVDGDGHVVFAAGPSHERKEKTVRHTARPPFAAGDAPVAFTIGPVDFPDTAADQKGARFLDSTRGYSGTGMDNVEHYCLDCSFRPWLDATGRLTATVTIGGRHERLTPDAGGRFRSRSALRPGERATIEIVDAWGDTTDLPALVNR